MRQDSGGSDNKQKISRISFLGTSRSEDEDEGGGGGGGQ